MSRNNIAIGEQKAKEAKANLIPKVTANADYRYYFNLPYQLLPVNAFSPAMPKGDYRAIQFGVPHNITPTYNCQCLCIIRKFTEQLIQQNRFGIDRITIPKNRRANLF